MDRVCFGRSGIHGWGLFARRNIQEGEMVSIAIIAYFFQDWISSGVLKNVEM